MMRTHRLRRIQTGRGSSNDLLHLLSRRASSYAQAAASCLILRDPHFVGVDRARALCVLLPDDLVAGRRPATSVSFMRSAQAWDFAVSRSSPASSAASKPSADQSSPE